MNELAIRVDYRELLGGENVDTLRRHCGDLELYPGRSVVTTDFRGSICPGEIVRVVKDVVTIKLDLAAFGEGTPAIASSPSAEQLEASRDAMRHMSALRRRQPADGVLVGSFELLSLLRRLYAAEAVMARMFVHNTEIDLRTSTEDVEDGKTERDEVAPNG